MPTSQGPYENPFLITENDRKARRKTKDYRVFMEELISMGVVDRVDYYALIGIGPPKPPVPVAEPFKNVAVALDGDVTEETATVTWELPDNIPPGLTLFNAQIEWYSTAGGGRETVPASDLTFTTGVLKPGVTYTFDVYAIYSGGYEAMTKVVVETTPIPALPEVTSATVADRTLDQTSIAGWLMQYNFTYTGSGISEIKLTKDGTDISSQIIGTDHFIDTWAPHNEVTYVLEVKDKFGRWSPPYQFVDLWELPLSESWFSYSGNFNATAKTLSVSWSIYVYPSADNVLKAGMKFTHYQVYENDATKVSGYKTGINPLSVTANAQAGSITSTSPSAIDIETGSVVNCYARYQIPSSTYTTDPTAYYLSQPNLLGQITVGTAYDSPHAVRQLTLEDVMTCGDEDGTPVAGKKKKG
jgi:hypothetical protein